ncbi:MAG: hypothetical protein HYZ72_06280 [Deltaproteobacteria bacterium]|nr:hypothetical protein [Deltaproteobacteria bacterium]
MNRAAAALCLGASSLHRSQSAVGAYFRRMKSRLGTPKAVTATAHHMARLVYHTRRYGRASVKKTPADDDALMRHRPIKRLTRKAHMLGCEVVERVLPLPPHVAPEDHESPLTTTA